MNIVFMGCTNYSKELLNHLLENEFNINLILTIPEEFKISYSDTKVKNYNYTNLKSIANVKSIECHEVDSIPGKKLDDYYDIIKKCNPDLILVLGWYYKVPKKIRDIARYGAWGIHPSMLPKYAGGAPLTWSIMNGEKFTGVTLFRLEDGVDNGDIIDQIVIPINFKDSIREMYTKVTEASKVLLSNVLGNIDQVKFFPQDKNSIEIWPQRSPDDGEIDLSKPSHELYNFIRAQSDPYPGAFIRTSDGKKLIIEKARIE